MFDSTGIIILHLSTNSCTLAKYRFPELGSDITFLSTLFWEVSQSPKIMEIINNTGRTSIIYRYAKGLVAKMPREMSAGLPGREEWDVEIDNALMVEELPL